MYCRNAEIFSIVSGPFFRILDCHQNKVMVVTTLYVQLARVMIVNIRCLIDQLARYVHVGVVTCRSCMLKPGSRHAQLAPTQTKGYSIAIYIERRVHCTNLRSSPWTLTHDPLHYAIISMMLYPSCWSSLLSQHHSIVYS